MDIKYGLTRGLIADATFNTDFAQVEEDVQQVNLTRFSLFFPEKREFFLESPASFQIGLAEPENQEPRRDLVPFFSRRIGLSSDGRPVPVLGGLRLTGRTGRHGIGRRGLRLGVGIHLLYHRIWRRMAAVSAILGDTIPGIRFAVSGT